MGTIPGPIIRLILDSSGLGGSSVAPAMNEIRSQARAASESVAESWRVTAAKIRAELTSGVSTQREMNAERERLIGTLNSEIRALQERNTISNRELSTLKAMTLERERQVDAIKRGANVGITAGTSSALGYGASQVGTQATLGIERIVDSIVNRYLGGAAGALTRTVRDVTYYANQASGGTGGILSNLGSGLSTIIEKVGPANLALGGMVVTMGALGLAAGSVTLSLAKANEQFENTAAVTGLSSRQVQIFSQLAKENSLDINGIVTSIARFQSELGEYIRKGEGANTETIRFVAGLKSLGITVTDTGGKLRDPVSILTDLSNVLRAVPDPAERSARALDILGVRGRELAPLLLSNKGALSDLVAEINKSGPIIGEYQAAQLDRAKTAWNVLTRSISATTLSLKEFVAEQFISATQLDKLGPRLPSPSQALYDQITRAGKGSLAPGASFFLGSQADADADLRKQQEIQAGGKRQLELEDVRKKYSEALKDNQTELAAQLLRQVNALKDAVDLEKKRLELYKQIASESARLHPGQTEQEKFEAEAYKTLGPSLGISKPQKYPVPILPSLNLPGISGGPALPVADAPDGILGALQAVNDEYLRSTQSETEKIKAEFDKQLIYWKIVQLEYPKSAQQAADAITKIQEIESKKLADIQAKQFEQYKKDADKLFDDLLSGNTKSFAKTLQKDILDIVTQPARKFFDDFVGKMLQGLDQTINGKGTGSAGSGTGSSSSGGVFGTILGKFGIGPGGTAGTFKGPLGLGGSGSGSVAIQTGQTGVMTQTMNVTANVVNLSSGGSGTSSGSSVGSSFLGGGPSSFFGNLNPFGGGSSFFGNNNAFGGSTSAGGGLGNAGGILGGLILAGSGVAGRNIQSTISGATVTAQSLAKAFGGSSNVAQGIGGIGGIVGGVAQGGLGGTLQATAGGAELGAAIGTAIMPGLGTLVGAGIGAAAGAISGAISSLVGGPSWATRVKKAMKNQMVIQPPSETFDFASNGSIANTLQTGFSQSGNTFSTFQLPANTPFWADPIHGPLSKLQQQILQGEGQGLIPGQPFFGLPGTPNPFSGQGPLGYKTGSVPGGVNIHFNLPGVIDAGSVGTSLRPHAEAIANLVVAKMHVSSSGLGRMVRGLAFPP